MRDYYIYIDSQILYRANFPCIQSTLSKPLQLIMNDATVSSQAEMERDIGALILIFKC